MNQEIKVFLCKCNGEGIAIENEDEGINFSFWQRGFYSKQPVGIKERIRWAWHILTTGTFWTDEVILDYDTAQELSNEIERLVIKEKNE